MKLSVALAVKNEEKNLPLCLDSIKEIADEIIIVDGGSNDSTVEIAKTYGATVIQTDNPPIFHINKQKALDLCKGEWILQMDADEVIPRELREEILEKISYSNKHILNNQIRNIKNSQEIETSKNVYAGYFISRKNYFLGHWMKKGGQFPDYVIRLFKNGKGKFPCKSVHEQIEIFGDIGYLKNPMDHYSYHTVREYWKKSRCYILLTSTEIPDTNNSIGIAFQYIIIKPIRTFFLLFFRHKGFIDHIYGFMFALFSALHYPLAFYYFVVNKKNV
jgi:glycosyltransferase involved in cell wall biosynthesis